MSVTATIFREYDIRGLVGTELNDEAFTLIGKGFGTYLLNHGARKISLGGDVRLTTEHFKKVIAEGLMSTGIDILDIGIVPTPVSYFSLFHLPVEGGVMVTASHNPADYNGVKLALGNTTIFGEEIQKVLKIIQAGKFASGRGSIISKEITLDYQKVIKEKVHLKRKLKVVVDCGNGSAALFAHQLYKEMGCEVIELFCIPDGRFPNHHPDPTVEKNLKDLIAKVKECKADVGIAFDGDADRIGVIDDQGEIIWGDKLLILYAREVLSRMPKSNIIFEVKCSQALIQEIERAGGVPVMWKTGHSLLKKKMKEMNSPLAGEMSGHMFFADDYFGYDDAIYAGARLLKILDQSSVPLSEMMKDVPKFYSTPEMRVNCKDDLEKFQIVEKAKEYFRKRFQTIDIDGVRILFEDGWGLVRASNTQPILVLRFEAATQSRLNEIQELVVNQLKHFGDIHI